MEWRNIAGGFSMATVADGEPADEALREFCRRIRDDVLPKNKGVDWDYLRVEFWPDSGRLIAFPANSFRSVRIEKAGCQVVFAELLGVYEELADSDMEDVSFTAALKSAEQVWIDRFILAAQDSGLSGQNVQFWDCDGKSPIRNVTV